MCKKQRSQLVLLVLIIMLNEVCPQEETTTEVFVTDVESPEWDSYGVENKSRTEAHQEIPHNDPIDEWANSVLKEETPNTRNFCKCGKSNTQNRIINGQESAPNAWPWMVAFAVQPPQFGNGTLYNNLFQGFCGGTIISDRYVLTAAHCVAAMREIDPSWLWAIVGDNNINGVPSSSRTVFGISSLRTHPKYNFTTFDYDVGLVKLNTTIRFSSNVSPICLGQGGAPFTSVNAVVAGWGLIQGGNDNSASNSLRQTTIQVQSQSSCNATFGNSATYTRNMLCAYTSGTNACMGDSGGPLMTPRSPSSLVYKQIGIVSYGLSNCPVNAPTYFARVQRVISWIRAFTKDGNYCLDSFSN